MEESPLTKKIREQSPYLGKHLSNTLLVLTYLNAEGIILDTEKETVLAKSEGFSQNISLFDILKKKDLNADASKNLLIVFKKTGNEHLIEKLQERENETEENILKVKWWPRIQPLVKSLHNRKNGEILLIDYLRNLLLEEGSQQEASMFSPTVVLSGMGGVGKSTTARSYSKKFGKYYDHIIWIQCGEHALFNSLKLLASHLKIENLDFYPDAEAISNEIFEKLSRLKCLLIFDNVEGFLEIPQILPSSPNFHCIVTSRKSEQWGHHHGLGNIPQCKLDVFHVTESNQFLEINLCKEICKRADLLDDLCILLGNLPLALQIAVATLNRRNVDLSGYIQGIREYDSAIINTPFDDYKKSIYSAMLISLEMVQKVEIVGKLASKVLSTIGFLRSDDIDTKLFGTVEKSSDHEIENAINLLEDFSLITRSTNSKPENKIYLEEWEIKILENCWIEKLKENLPGMRMNSIHVKRILGIFKATILENMDLAWFKNTMQIADTNCIVGILRKSSSKAEGTNFNVFNWILTKVGRGKKTITFLSIHRLVQQAIRQKERDNKTNILRKILQCEGYVDYKLMPYMYATESLKIEFRNVQAELVNQLELRDLLAQKRNSEAVHVSKMIAENIKTEQPQHNTSLLNYAVCLTKDGQILKATEIFESLYDQLRFEGEFLNTGFGVLDLHYRLHKCLVGGHLFLLWCRQGDERSIMVFQQMSEYLKTVCNDVSYLVQLIKQSELKTYSFVYFRNMPLFGIPNTGSVKTLCLWNCVTREEIPEDLDDLSLGDVSIFRNQQLLPTFNVSLKLNPNIQKLTISSEGSTHFYVELNKLKSVKTLILMFCTVILQSSKGEDLTAPTEIKLLSVKFLLDGRNCNVKIHEYVNFKDARHVRLARSNISIDFRGCINIHNLELISIDVIDWQTCNFPWLENISLQDVNFTFSIVDKISGEFHTFKMLKNVKLMDSLHVLSMCPSIVETMELIGGSYSCNTPITLLKLEQIELHGNNLPVIEFFRQCSNMNRVKIVCTEQLPLNYLHCISSHLKYLEIHFLSPSVIDFALKREESLPLYLETLILNFDSPDINERVEFVLRKVHPTNLLIDTLGIPIPFSIDVIKLIVGKKYRMVAIGQFIHNTMKSIEANMVKQLVNEPSPYYIFGNGRRGNGINKHAFLNLKNILSGTK